jgi:predicted alpha/beta-hydrolase family hydrolase
MTLGSVFFLEGDSFVAESRAEKSLRRRLKFRRWTSQSEMTACVGDEKLRTDIPTRLAILERLMPHGREDGPTVIFGRSSGARVGSLFTASRPGISVMVCFAYPFRNPKRPMEPERYAHLAGISTPTLIVQGRADSYGGIEIIGKYPLSEAVTVRFVDCGHDFKLMGDRWREVAELVVDFCARHAGASVRKLDEAGFLPRGPDHDIP